jgi:cytochrome c biogenesis factor
MKCTSCGVELAENATSCPTCGAVVVVSATPTAPIAEKQTNVMAIVGFIISLVSLFWNGYFICSILAIIFSAVGLNKVKTANSGKGLAIAGLVIGIVGIVLSFVAASLLLRMFR